MTIAQRIDQVSANLETAARVNEFVALARFMMLSKGSFARVTQLAKGAHLGPNTRIERILEEAEFGKSAQSASGFTASAFADFSVISQGFVNSLVNASAFDGMLASMVPVPLGTGTVGGQSCSLAAI